LAEILQPAPRENAIVDPPGVTTVLPGKPTIPWTEWFDLIWGMFTSVFVTGGGRVKAVLVINSDTNLTEDNHVVLCDTDGGAITVTFPTGIDGTEYEIRNVGSSGNDVTLAGPETIEETTLYDGEALQYVFSSTENWRAK